MRGADVPRCCAMRVWRAVTDDDGHYVYAIAHRTRLAGRQSECWRCQWAFGRAVEIVVLATALPDQLDGGSVQTCVQKPLG